MLWFYFALIHSFFRAAYSETSHIYKTDPWHLVLWQAIFAVIFLAVLIPFMAWPDHTGFYFAAMSVGLLFAGGLLFQLNLSAMHLGRVLGIYVPLEAFAAFVIWSVISPESWALISEHVFWVVGILAAFLVGTAGLYKIRDNDINLKTLAYVVPIGLSFAVAGIVTKLVLPVPGQIVGSNSYVILSDWGILPYALTYVFFTYLVTIPVLATVLAIKKKLGPEFRTMVNMQAGIMTGVFSAIAYIAFVSSVVLVVNPGMTSFITILLPVWLYVFHRIDKRTDDAGFASAGMIVLAVAGLAALTAFFG